MLGKIYCNNKNFEAIQFIKVLPISEYVYDENVPTLIIGKKNAEEVVGKENVKVLDKNIKKNLQWTFSKIEKRSEYEKDIMSFYDKVFKNKLKDIKYNCIDLYNISYSELKRLVEYLKNNKEKHIYITNNHIYIYCENNVTGLSLCEAEFLGVKSDKIINKLKGKKQIKLVFNDFFLKNSIKKYINSNKFVIPYLYSIKNQ